MSRKTARRPAEGGISRSSQQAAAAREVPVWVLCAGLLVAVVSLYLRTVGYDFIDLDDVLYVTDNPYVNSGLSWKNVLWAFDIKGTFYFHPLTWLSLMLDYTLFGSWAGGFHATNFLLHSFNSVLLFLLVLRLVENKWVALAVGAAFGLHPMHVEAVAWVTARKDVLSTLFGLGVLHIYVSWVRRGGMRLWLLAIAVHAVGLLAKPMLVTMPGLMLALDLWPLHRAGGNGRWPDFRKIVSLILEKWPYILLGLVSGLVTMTSHPEAYSVYEPDFALRLSNAVVSYARYLGLLFLPVGQAVLYPFPSSIPLYQLIFCGLIVLGSTALCVWQWPRRPYLAVGWAWFLMAFAPIIVLQRYGLLVAYADRWTYVPYWGIYVALAMLASEAIGKAWERPDLRKWVVACAVFPFLLMFFASWRQLDYWRNKYISYERALAVTKDNYYVLNNYGVLLHRKGDASAAERYLTEAVRLFPNYPTALANLGQVYAAQGRFAEAIELFRKSLKGDVQHGSVPHEEHAYLGLCLVQLGRLDEAVEHYNIALQLKPDYAVPYNDLGNIALSRGDLLKAKAMYEKAMQLDPGYELARRNLSNVKARLAAGG